MVERSHDLCRQWCLVRLGCPDDPDYVVAQAWFHANREPLVTTDYVVDELLTLFKTRGEFQRCLDWGRQLLEERVAQIEWVHPSDIHRAWIIFPHIPIRSGASQIV